MQTPESPLPNYFRILRRQAWIVLLVLGATLGATGALLHAQKPVYRASMTLVVGEPRGDLPPVLGSHSVARTMTNLLESDLLARSVIRDLDLNMSTEDFLKKLTVQVLPDTAVLAVSYDSTNRDRAVEVLTELARNFTREVDQTLGVRFGQKRAGSFSLIVRMFDPPHLEPKTVERNAVRTLAFAGGLGLVLGLLLAVARDGLDSRIREPGDAEAWFGAPVIAALSGGLPKALPDRAGGRRGKRAARRLAQLDLLRARLEFAQKGVGGPTILVSSADTKDDVTGVAANLAAAFARAGRRVICVDADLLSPQLGRYVGGEDGRPGIVDVLEHRADLDDALTAVDLEPPSENGSGPSDSRGSLELLEAGTTAVAGGLQAEAMVDLATRLLERADYIVIAAPPLFAAEAIPLALHADSVLVVARHGRTTRQQATAARSTLESLGVSKVGVVLTDAPSR